MGTGKKKIEIKKKEKESDRMVTFSKRRRGLFKKAHELHTKTGAEVAILVFSPAGNPYSHGEPSFDATVDKFMASSGSGCTTVKETENGNGADCGGDMGLWWSWLKTVQVEDYGEVEDLLALKKTLEEIRANTVKEIEDQFVRSFLV
ncbi:hypothetical protein RJ639_019937 [Escallonia herrerae]|uniref:MADS-box domain-containing protein n=1 Tax=Escallonia herrerae TaxID=1293975 RepID=A0AA89AHP1_9ASTE|nr:hypothetical protein RJ639_019937 [Escallonia herrerae]